MIPVKTGLADGDLYLSPASSADPDLFICDSLGHSNHHTTAHLLIANTSDCPLTLENSDILAEAMPIDATPFDTNCIPVSSVSNTKQSAPPKPTPDQLKRFLNDIDLEHVLDIVLDDFLMRERNAELFDMD